MAGSFSSAANADVRVPASLRVTTVGELSNAHAGWLIRVTPRPDATVDADEFVLAQRRLITTESMTSEPLILVEAAGTGTALDGIDHRYPAGTPCTVLRPVTARAQRLALMAS